MSLPRTGRQPVLATRGAVAAPHHAAAQAGLNMLQRGGSAVDAAIAANAVLAVVYPHMAGLGGDLFALVWDAQRRESRRPQRQRAFRCCRHDRLVPRAVAIESIPSRGPLACVTVPGAVSGWWQLHQRFGRLPWDILFEPGDRARDRRLRGAGEPGRLVHPKRRRPGR